MSSHDEEARDGSRHAANRRTGHFRPAARTLILASVSLSFIGCHDPAVPTSALAQADDARAYDNRGNAWVTKLKYDQAIADFNEVIRLDPSDARSYNGRAWIWATCHDAKYRDGKRAVESATRACELSGWKEPNDMNTLATACAEAGDFAAAVQWQSKAIELLSDEKRKADYRTRLTLYREKKPYRESPRPKS